MIKVTISDTPGGHEYAENLRLGLGLNYGRLKNGSYTPVDDQIRNTGYKSIYISHNGTEKIQDVHVFITPYSRTYGGHRSASEDFNYLMELGRQSAGRTSNNEDGMAGGLHLEFDLDSGNDAAFSGETSKIVGKHGGDTMDSAFLIPVISLINDPSPEPGCIKPGKAALVKSRLYMPEKAVRGGVFQWDTNIIFTYEA